MLICNLCFRKQTQASRLQQRADLEDAMFSLEQQHKAAMDEIHTLYKDSLAAYESAHDDRVTDRSSSLCSSSLTYRCLTDRCGSCLLSVDR